MDKQNNETLNRPVMVIVNIQSPLISQADLYRITHALADRTRKETGCLEYNCYRSTEDESILEAIIFKNADAHSAHSAHMSSPHVLEILDEHQSLNLQYSVQRVHYCKEDQGSEN